MIDVTTLPIIRESGDEDCGYLFSFGNSTHVIVLGGSLENGLESCFEWLDDNAPGLLSKVDYAEAARELNLQWPSDDHQIQEEVSQKAEVDMTMCGHTTLTHGDCIPSWEWTVRDLDKAELQSVTRG